MDPVEPLQDPEATIPQTTTPGTSSQLAAQARVLQQVIDQSISRALSNTVAEVTASVDASVRTALLAQTQPSPGLPPSLAATPGQPVILVNLSPQPLSRSTPWGACECDITLDVVLSGCRSSRLTIHPPTSIHPPPPAQCKQSMQSNREHTVKCILDTMLY